MTKEFLARGMLMEFFPTRFTVNSFMHWAGFTGSYARPVLDLMLLMGEHDVIYDPPTALARARRLIPHFQGELLPGCSHDMASSQHSIVDTRILDFLKRTAANGQDHTSERFVA